MSPAHFYTFCTCHSMSCEFGAEPRPRGGPASGTGSGWSPGQGCSPRAAWIHGRPGRGRVPPAVPSLLGLVQAWEHQAPAQVAAWLLLGLGPGWRAGGLGTRGGFGQPNVY